MWSVIDIETHPLPTDQVLRFEPTEYKLGNVKDAQKKLEVIAEKRAKFIEDATLDAKCCFIQAIGYWTRGDADVTVDIIDSVEQEYDLLMRFWQWCREQEARFTDGFTGATRWALINFMLRRFDLPMIVRRSWHYGIVVPSWTYLTNSKGPGPTIIDIVDRWGMGEHYEYISLRDLARHLDVGDKIETELFWKLYQKYPERAITYLKNDVILARDCTIKMGIRAV